MTRIYASSGFTLLDPNSEKPPIDTARIMHDPERLSVDTTLNSVFESLAR